jgi:predicted transcriptional regulator
MSEKAKLSVSIDGELDAALREVAEQRHEQISTVVSHALVDYLAIQRRRLDGLAAMAEYQREHGAFTDEERREADAELDELLGVDSGTGPEGSQQQSA